MDEWVTITTLARNTGLPESSARRYAKLFPDYFPIKRVGRMVLYPTGCGQVLTRIAELFASGRKREQVAEILAREIPRTIEMVTDGPQPSEPMAASPGALDQVAEFMRVVADQKQELATLREDFTQVRAELDQVRRRSEVQARLNANYKKALMALAKLRKQDAARIRELKRANMSSQQILDRVRELMGSMDQAYRADIDRLSDLMAELLGQ